MSFGFDVNIVVDELRGIPVSGLTAPLNSKQGLIVCRIVNRFADVMKNIVWKSLKAGRGGSEGNMAVTAY